MMTDLDRLLRDASAWTLKLRPEVLLCPNVPKPMHGVAPRLVMGERWWNAVRRAALESSRHHCVACGVHKLRAMDFHRLECHELYDVDYLLGRMTYLEAVPLCNWCHCFIHDGRLQVLRDKGEITQDKFSDIMEHGRQVLLAAGLKKNLKPPKACADWADWRLVVEGKEFPPKFPTFEAWQEEFSK